MLMASGCTVAEPTPVATETLSYAQRMEVWTERTAACMRERGWPARSNGMGIDSFGYPYDQHDIMTADMLDCWNLYGSPSEPKQSAEITPEAATNYFAALNVEAECLRELGFTFPDPPSEQSFIDGLLGDEGLLVWDPFLAVQSDQRYALGITMTEAKETCPVPSIWEFVH